MVYGIKFMPKRHVSIKESKILETRGATVVTRSGIMNYYITDKQEAFTAWSVLSNSCRSGIYDFDIITTSKEKVDKSCIVATAKEFFEKEKGQSFSDVINVR